MCKETSVRGLFHFYSAFSFVPEGRFFIAKNRQFPKLNLMEIACINLILYLAALCTLCAAAELYALKHV